MFIEKAEKALKGIPFAQEMWRNRAEQQIEFAMRSVAQDIYDRAKEVLETVSFGNVSHEEAKILENFVDRCIAEFSLHQREVASVGSRNLTEEEISGLSFDLKCCFHIQPWNSSFDPDDIDSWAEGIGWFKFRDNEDSPKDAMQRAKEEVIKLKLFIKDYFSK